MARHVYVYLLFISLGASAQEKEYITLSGSYETTDLISILDEINQSSPRKVHYKKEWFEGFHFKGAFSNDSIERVLRKLLLRKGFAFVEYQDDFYIIKSNSLSEDLAKLIGINLSTREMGSIEEHEEIARTFNEISMYRLSGNIREANTSNPIVTALVKVNNGEFSTVSDDQGHFELQLPFGTHEIVLTQLAYEPTFLEVPISSDKNLDIEMFSKSQTLDEVVISANNLQSNLTNVESDMTVIDLRSIKNLPTFLGEVDIIKNITSLPGVTTVGEGASGFNVRGGNVDENLILLDGMPIFNSSHLFGFFSVFSADVVDKFTLYKGGIPSRYGGRISSILDVSGKTGDLSRTKFSATGGLVTSKLKLETPIVGDKTSVILGIRAGYPTYLFDSFPNDQVKNSSANFFDVNSKVHHVFSKKSTLSVSNYFSKDNFRFGQDTTYRWNNFGTSISWQKILSSGESIQLRGAISDYKNSILSSSTNREFEFNSSIGYKSIEGNYLKPFTSGTLLEVGFQTNFYDLNNGDIKPTQTSSVINPQASDPDRAIESAIYFSTEKRLGSKTNIQTGLRVSFFANRGSKTVYVYENPNLPSLSTVSDTLNTSGFFGNTMGYEPRFNLNHTLSPTASLKFGYNLTRQNIHVISITSAIAPGDYWKLSDPNIPTTTANQINLGYTKLFDKYGISVDSYYKAIENLIDYRDGAQVFLNPRIETALVRAKGRSYGLELKIEKEGKLNGWISYTFSRSERNSFSNFGEEIWFPTAYDRPHNFNMTSSLELNKRINFSWNLVVTSGRAITIPETAYFFNNNLFVDYSERNGGRIPSYQRLDLSLTIDGNLRKSGFKSRWAFSIYNIFGRRNPFSVFFDTVVRGALPQGYKLSILGQAFPSISYSFEIN